MSIHADILHLLFVVCSKLFSSIRGTFFLIFSRIASAPVCVYVSVFPYGWIQWKAGCCPEIILRVHCCQHAGRPRKSLAVCKKPHKQKIPISHYFVTRIVSRLIGIGVGHVYMFAHNCQSFLESFKLNLYSYTRSGEWCL